VFTFHFRFQPFPRIERRNGQRIGAAYPLTCSRETFPEQVAAPVTRIATTCSPNGPGQSRRQGVLAIETFSHHLSFAALSW